MALSMQTFRIVLFPLLGLLLFLVGCAGGTMRSDNMVGEIASTTSASQSPESITISKSVKRRSPESFERGRPATIDTLAIVNDEPFADTYFTHYSVNPTIDTAESPLSTFSVDVDTASYALTRAYLDNGKLPSRAAIRVEEFVNAFDYGYQGPSWFSNELFAVNAELFPSPSRPGYHVLHVGLKGREVHPSTRKPANLTFVIDVSGSMDQGGRLILVMESLRLLLNELRQGDRVSIVAYNETARVVLANADASQKSLIEQAISSLSPGGSTNAGAGLQLGYRVAQEKFNAAQINRVILCSDGVANTGTTGAEGIHQLIRRQASAGIDLTTVGVGLGNYNDVLLEQLAQSANGIYYYVDRLAEARKVFNEQLTGTLQTLARDAKIQLQFNPKSVARYRLLGYENRALQDNQFYDDRTDAGEIGAGHSVTALYEVKLRPGRGLIAKLRLRYKRPGQEQSEQIDKHIGHDVLRSRYASASSPARLSMLVAAFAEKLRGSYWARATNYRQLATWHDNLPDNWTRQPQVRELARLIDTAARLDHRQDRFNQYLPVSMMSYDRVPILR